MPLFLLNVPLTSAELENSFSWRAQTFKKLDSICFACIFLRVEVLRNLVMIFNIFFIKDQRIAILFFWKMTMVALIALILF